MDTHTTEELNIPAELRILYVDEAALFAADKELADAESEYKEAILAQERQKSFVQRALTRFKGDTEKCDLKTELSKLQSARAICLQLKSAIGPEIEKGTEQFLRENCEPYLRGLAAGKLNEDWERAVTGFRDSLREYIMQLGQSRNMVVAGYNKVDKAISPVAREAVDKAIRVAQDLRGHTDFVNAVVDQQHELVKDTPVDDNYLPRLPLADYVGWTEALTTMEIAPMQLHYNHILELCETLVGPGILELEQALNSFIERNRKASESFVLNFVARTRQKAAKDWLHPGLIQSAIHRMEDKYKTAQLPYSFGPQTPAAPTP